MYDRPVSTEYAPRTIAAAIALWGSAVTAAAFSNAFAKFSMQELAVLVAFSLVMATATCYLDKAVRAAIDAVDLRALAILAVVADIGIAAAVGLAFVPACVFAVPLAGAAHVVLVDRMIRARPWSAGWPVRVCQRSSETDPLME